MTPDAPLDLTAAAALFDMDGTLVDSHAVVESLWAGFADRYDVDLDALLGYSHGRQTTDTVGRFLPDGIDPLPVIAELEAAGLERLDEISEVPGAAALLGRLRGTPVAVVTSAPRDLTVRRLEAVGIPVPDVLVCAEDVAEGKPSPEGYLRAAELLGAVPRACVALEDAEAGLRAAVASGAQVVVVGPHESPTTRGLARVRDLRDVEVVRGDGVVRFRERRHASAP